MTRTETYSWEIAQGYRADLDGAEYWRHARRRVAEIMTATLERSGTERHYTHLSNAERGLTHKPQKKLDKRKTRTAREGEFVADVEANRRTIEANIRLEKALEAKRKERRKRALKHRLSVLARVELAVRSPLDLRPVTQGEADTARASIFPTSTIVDQHIGISLGKVEAPQDRSPIASIAPVEVSPIAPPRPLELVAIPPEKGKQARQVKPIDGGIAPRSETNVKTFRPPGAGISTDINVVALKSSPPPALTPVSTTSNPTIKLRPVATVPPPRAPLRPVGKAADTNVTLRPVASTAPEVNAPGISKLSPVGPPIQTLPTLRRVEAPQSTPPVLAPVAVPSVKDRPSLLPVASDSAAAKFSAGLLRLQPVKPVPDLKIGLHAVETPGLGKDHDLRRVEPTQARERLIIRTVSLAPERPVIEPMSLPTGAWNANPSNTLRPVDPPRQARIDPALVETMRAFGERLERMAQELPDKRGQVARPSQLPKEDEAVRGARDLDPTGNAIDALQGEIEAARAFVARVKGKAIHVGINEEGWSCRNRCTGPETA